MSDEVPPVEIYAGIKNQRYASGDTVKLSVLVLNTLTTPEMIPEYSSEGWALQKKEVKIEWYVSREGSGDTLLAEAKEIELDPFVSKFVVLYWHVPPSIEAGKYSSHLKVYVKKSGVWESLSDNYIHKNKKLKYGIYIVEKESPEFELVLAFFGILAAYFVKRSIYLRWRKL